MSCRSILLATTVCIALGTSAEIDHASAHGGGGGFHSAGAPSISRMSSQSVSPTPFKGTIVGKPVIPSVAFPLRPTRPSLEPLGPAETANVQKPGIAPGGFSRVGIIIIGGKP
jgi:hypothetical protein